MLTFLCQTREWEDRPPTSVRVITVQEQIGANDVVDRDRKADHRKLHQTQPFHLTVCIRLSSRCIRTKYL